jgi:hypothetical protein
VPAEANEFHSELECLRLASELRKLASSSLSEELRDHCLHMAKVWTDLAEASFEGHYFYLDC